MQLMNNTSPSSSPKSSSSSSLIKDISNFFRKSKIARRLTGQRKLRNLPDIEVGRFPFNNFEGDDLYSARSSPGLPQPLPLPELASLSRDSPLSASTSSSRLPLPAHKNRVHADADDSAADLARNSTYRSIPKSPERADAQSIKSPINRGKKAFQDRNGFDNVQKSLWLNASYVMSAPGSGVSSPSLSPRRMSTGDALFSPNVTTQRFAWSSPEMTPMDMDPFILASYNKLWSFPECSPHQGHGMHSRSPSGASSPLHQESNGHTNVHPLPLPPGPTVSSHSMLTHQTITKADVSTMTSQWQKGKLIGRGTFGSVYVGTNRETGALCAMKEVDLIPDDPKSAECMKQLEQEIKLLSQLKHPNIVQYYGSEIVGNHFYIYLEFVHPGSINKYVREHCGAITESVVRSFTRHILQGLAYLHSTKTVHRDIKGANLLVDASGVVKLADFGMAKHLTGQTTDLSLKGSPYWMAPEIIHAANQKDTNGDFAFAVDIWSLGCTIIEIVNGKPPWSEFEGAAAMFKAWKETPPIPETLSPLGKDFLQCCFRRNPAERPTAIQLLEHPFLKNSYQTERQASTRSFMGMKLG